MASRITLRPVLMKWNDMEVSDHNRTPLDVSVEEISRTSRMANGRLRKYIVARKRSWTCSWDLLPDSNDTPFGMTTVDMGLAAGDIEHFYNENEGAIDLKLYNGRGDESRYSVMIDSFSKSIEKRGSVDLWSVSITLKEI